VLIFFDLETTGLNEDDKVVSLGLVVMSNTQSHTVYELINEGKKISPIASSINHITNEMLVGKTSCIESEIYTILNSNNSLETTLVVHNAKFILEKLQSCGIEWKGAVIDTLKVTKHLIPECEQFSLQILRYELKLYKKENEELKFLCINEHINAHHSLSDAVVIKLLYSYLLEMVNHTKMQNLTFENVLIQKFTFGKYKDEYIEDILLRDRAYLIWMLEKLVDIDEDLRYSIDYYLKGEI